TAERFSRGRGDFGFAQSLSRQRREAFLARGNEISRCRGRGDRSRDSAVSEGARRGARLASSGRIAARAVSGFLAEPRTFRREARGDANRARLREWRGVSAGPGVVWFARL